MLPCEALGEREKVMDGFGHVRKEGGEDKLYSVSWFVFQDYGAAK